jgi:2-polyprenyl-3-methyl-5-hydroxy-6-metoxy-1,4-benzoquinol methylase
MSRLAPSPHGTELLDDPAADPATVALSLRNIARANWWFGGWAAIRYGLGRLLAPGRASHPGQPPGPEDPKRLAGLTLLDVGTGTGDLPARAVRWGAGRGISIRAVGLERSPVAARLARGRGLPTLVGCAGDLPLPDRSVDLVTASQLAHHLDADSCRTLFRECARVARLGVVVADLHPSPLAAIGFRLGGAILRFDAVTIDDGVTSLGRGFTTARLATLLAGAGISAAVTRRPGARVVAWWRA